MIRLFPTTRRPLAGLGLLLGTGLLTLAAAPAGSPQRWQLDTFRAFSEGSLPDGGVNIYAAADGTVRLINAFDLNQDGLPDIFLPSSHAYKEVTDLSIFWDDHGYDAKRVGHLPTLGGKAAALADLNHDGYPDLVVANSFDGTRTDLSLVIYWGSPEGFSPARRSELPAQGAQAVAVADLRGDGWPALVVVNSGLTYHVAVDSLQASTIYWNDHGKFAPERKTTLPTINGRDVAVADLKGDGTLAIVVANAGNVASEAGARIFWAQHGNYDLAHSTFLPGVGCTAVAIGDLNRDGRPDLVLANGRRLKSREAGIYDIVDTVALDSTIYWNSAAGFDPAHRTDLPTVAASGVALADLDGDGWPEVIFANAEGGASFVYWNSPQGFLPRRRLALPTNNASAVVAADLNGDGHPDLVFANFNLGNDFDTDSFIYWGGPHGPSAERRRALPTSGASGIVVGDLRQRGGRDLVFINKQSGTGDTSPSILYLSDRANPQVFSPAKRIEVATHGVDAYAAADLARDGHPALVIPDYDGVSIYWGGSKAFRRETRTMVSTAPAQALRIADFNRDGYLDLMLSEWEPGSVETHIYYGGPNGFSASFRTALPVGGIRFPTIGDFNKDGWIDVAFPVFDEEKTVIFWNGPDGFKPERRTDLPGRSASNLEVADLNGDGYLDLIAPNFMTKHPTPAQTSRAFGGSPEGNLYIYWGSAAGYSLARKTVLPGVGSEDVSVADLRRTGRLDLVMSSYHAGTRRNLPSYIYWQGADGSYDPQRVQRIETNSASGNLVADFNGDGWPDILFANHQAESDHRNDSYLYWGGPQGFSPERRLRLPANGPHMMAVTDPGNVYDRRLSYDYISPAKQLAGAQRLRGLAWTGDTPPGTDIHVQFRSAASAVALASAPWEGPGGASADFLAPAAAAGLALHGPWVQFRAKLENPGGGLPVLRSVTLDFE